MRISVDDFRGARLLARAKADQYATAWPKLERIIEELTHVGEPLLIFVSESEGKNHEALWAFADDLAFAARDSQADEAVTIYIYKPSRDFQKIEAASQGKRLTVAAEGPGGRVEWHAGDDNRARLYAALPYLLGHAPKKAETPPTPR
jgi:hypothetical protein